MHANKVCQDRSKPDNESVKNRGSVKRLIPVTCHYYLRDVHQMLAALSTMANLYTLIILDCFLVCYIQQSEALPQIVPYMETMGWIHTSATKALFAGKKIPPPLHAAAHHAPKKPIQKTSSVECSKEGEMTNLSLHMLTDKLAQELINSCLDPPASLPMIHPTLYMRAA